MEGALANVKKRKQSKEWNGDKSKNDKQILK